MSAVLIQYVFKAALRDRFFIFMIVMLAAGISLSYFFGASAVIEQSAFALTFAAGGLRIAGMAGLVLFVIFYVRRAFETRDVEYLLARPITRLQYLSSHAFSFSCLAVFVTGLITLALVAMSSDPVSSGYVLWGISVMIELIIMVNVALFFSLVLSSGVGASLITFAFYVLARLIGQIHGILQSGSGASVSPLLEVPMNVVSMIVPRLDLIGQTSWLVHGITDTNMIGFFVLQGVLFSALVFLASWFDLFRKQF